MGTHNIVNGRINYAFPPDGCADPDDIRSTERGIVRRQGGNDNPEAEEVLATVGGLSEQTTAHLNSFRFVDGIQSKAKLLWQSISVAAFLAGGTRYKLVEWAYSPSSNVNPVGGGAHDTELKSYGQGENTLLVVVVHFSESVFVAGHANYQYQGGTPLPNHNVVPASGTPYLTLTRNIPGESQDTEILTYQDMSLQTNYDSTTRTLVTNETFFGDNYYQLSNRQYFNQYLYKNGSHSMAFVSKEGPGVGDPFPVAARTTGTTYSIPVNALSLNGGTITEGTSAGGDNAVITNTAAQTGTLTLVSDFYLANPNHYGLYVEL